MSNDEWTLESLNKVTKEINLRLREALGAMGVKHSEVAKAMGVGRANVTNQLTGNPTNSLRLVITVKELTGYSLFWLIGGIGQHRMPKDQDPKEEFDKIKSEHPKGDYLDSIIKQIEADRTELKADRAELKAELAKFGKNLRSDRRVR